MIVLMCFIQCRRLFALVDIYALATVATKIVIKPIPTVEYNIVNTFPKSVTG